MELTESYIQSLNEVYFGRTDGIQAIHNQLSLLRKKYIGTSTIPVNDKDLIKLNDLISKEFGFGRFNLQIVYDIVPAAHTVPMTYKYNIPSSHLNASKDYIVDKTGYRFKPDANLVCVTTMTTGLIFNNYFTDDEIMASLLYELGTVFYICFSDANAVLASIHSATAFATAMSNFIIHFYYIDTIGDAIEQSSRAKTLAFVDPFANRSPEKLEEFKKLISSMTPNEITKFLQSRFANKDIQAHNALWANRSKNASEYIKTGWFIYSLMELFDNTEAHKRMVALFKSDYENKPHIRSMAIGFVDHVKLVIKMIISAAANVIGQIFTILGSAKEKVSSALQSMGVMDFIVPYKVAIENAKNPLNWLSTIFDYKVNVAAGSFPTMYGYGAAEVTYFEKMKSNKQVTLVRHAIKKIPWIGVVYDCILLPAKIINGVFDNSPNGVARCMDQIKNLEYELSKQNLDAITKAQIQNDLVACKKALVKLTDISNGVKDPDILKKLYNKLLRDCLGSVGLKDAVINANSENRFKEYDDTYMTKLSQK